MKCIPLQWSQVLQRYNEIKIPAKGCIIGIEVCLNVLNIYDQRSPDLLNLMEIDYMVQLLGGTGNVEHR